MFGIFSKKIIIFFNIFDVYLSYILIALSMHLSIEVPKWTALGLKCSSARCGLWWQRDTRKRGVYLSVCSSQTFADCGQGSGMKELYVRPSVRLSFFLSFLVSICSSVRLPFFLSFFLSFLVSICSSVRLPFFLSFFLNFYLFVRSSILPSIRPSFRH